MGLVTSSVIGAVMVDRTYGESSLSSSVWLGWQSAAAESPPPTPPPVRKAVIPIAGWGTRMFPVTKSVPKALFPVVDKDGYCKPVLQLVIEEALSALPADGEICIVVQPGQQEPVEDYFKGVIREAYSKKEALQPLIKRLQDIGKRITFVEQTNMDGFGDAILCAKEFVNGEPFFVLLGDHIYTTDHSAKATCAQQVLEVYSRTGKAVTALDTCEEHTTGINGIVVGALDADQLEEGDTYGLRTTVEKPTAEYAREHLRVAGIPEGNYLCYFGIDLLTPEVFNVLQYNKDNNIRTKGEIQLRDAMKSVIESPSEGMYGIRVKGNRHDTGIPRPYAAAIAAFAPSN